MESSPKDYSRNPIFNAYGGPNVKETMRSKGRHVKSFVKIKIDDNLQYGLSNLSLKVKRGVSMNYGFEEQVHGGDEKTMYNCTNSEGVVTSNVVIPCVVLRSRHYSKTSQ
jgi:hypothetical protein